MTLHQDGYQVQLRSLSGNQVAVEVVWFQNGVFVEVVRQVGEAEVDSVALAQLKYLTEAFCFCLNTGMDRRQVVLWLEGLQRIPNLKPQYDPVAFVPPPQKPVVIWRDPQTKELYRAVSGDDGFTEKISEKNLEHLLS